MHGDQTTSSAGIATVQGGIRTCWWQWLVRAGQSQLSFKSHHEILMDWKWFLLERETIIWKKLTWKKNFWNISVAWSFTSGRNENIKYQ